MSLPFFYAPGLSADSATPELEEETMRHMVQVLRMKVDDQLKLTNGQGLSATALIETVSKKHCTVRVVETEHTPPVQHRITIAISPLKNPSRFEWFLEKSAETGIARIVPLICSRTEKQHIKKERWNSILVSAMLQSQQSWVTEIGDAEAFIKFISAGRETQRYIAHCMEGEKAELQQLVEKEHQSSLILIGPEGDFTAQEVELALAAGFKPVSLGHTRLRTETAGITAAILLSHA
ncbi:MAG TPA: RsmE family RNA methyltransferase [Chitinophagaceae bacterium]|nr:RsmE family RNA methyltransferase [Chitinophagaceae bacterium]